MHLKALIVSILYYLISKLNTKIQYTLEKVYASGGVRRNARRLITHLYNHNHLNRVPHAIHFNDLKTVFEHKSTSLLTINHTLFRNIKENI